MGSASCKEFSRRKSNQVTTEHVPVEQLPESSSYENGLFTEHILCSTGDLNDNQMKQFELGENGEKVLLIKQNGEYSAIGAKCSHYGAQLVNGALGQGRVRCPWHGACFDIQTGDIEDYPGLDSLPCYKVIVDEDYGLVKIRTSEKQLEAGSKRTKNLSKRNPKCQQTFVIVGGGPAAGVCAETLRQEGFEGDIVMICKELSLPYDRIKVSKAMSIELSTLQYRTQAFYDEYDIQTMLGTEAVSLNALENSVECSNSYNIHYNKIFIATGSRAIKPKIPGADIRNVLTLRDYEDAKKVTNLINENLNVVCLGSSFIALEAAAYCVNKVKSVTVIGREDVPLKASFGSLIGARVKQLFEENNVQMKFNSGIIKCNADETHRVESVVLTDNTVIPCELLIMGTGSIPYTGFLKDSGLVINDNGSIDTDIYLRSTSHPNVYIGGDIANAPVYSLDNKLATIGHYQLAQYHGRIAATNMVLNDVKELKAVPFFWTMLFNKNFRYAGHGKASNVIIDGSLDDLIFVAMFLDDDDYVCAMASCTRDPIVVEFAEFLSQGRKLHKSDLSTDKFAWRKLLTEKLTIDKL